MWSIFSGERWSASSGEVVKINWLRGGLSKLAKGDHFVRFFQIRTKTETTRVYDTQEIAIPLTEELKYYLNKVNDPSSPFVLGKLKEGYTQKSLLNRKNRFRQEINPELKKIGEKLNLFVPLIMSSARDCYGTTLKRNGVPIEWISDSYGHSDPKTTLHYLDGLSIDESFKVNNNLVKRKNRTTS